MAPGKEVACRTVTRVTASFGGDDLLVSEYVESEFAATTCSATCSGPN